MKKWVFLFSICALYLNAVPFYQNPSPEAAYQWLREQNLDQKDETQMPFALSAAATYMGQVIKMHPDYAETFASDFAGHSPFVKSIFAQAFAAAGIQDPRVPVEEATPLSDLDHIEFKSGHDFDLMIMSFLTTGDELFLTQPMAFLNSDPELLFYAYEFENRQALQQFAKEVLGIEAEVPDDDHFFDTINNWPQEKRLQFALRMTAVKCLGFMRQLDPTADEKITQLREANPNLDYPGTLAKILGEE